MEQKKKFSKEAYRFKRFVRKAYSAFNSMHRVVNIGVVTGCVLTMVHTTETSAQKQTIVNRDSIPDQALDEVIVTVSKVDLKLNQVARFVTVISKEEIARQPVQSIEDLLKSVAGIDVRQRGANGVQADISVRGGTFDQVAILLNGANLSNPQTGHYSFDIPINLSDIEQIEIIQGPSSLLYGASAFSGGINIITKKQTDSKAYASVEGGMHELFNVAGGGALQTKTSFHRLSAGYNSSLGYIADSDYKIYNTYYQSRFLQGNNKLDIQAGYNAKAYGANTFYSPVYTNQFDETQSIFASVRGETSGKLKFIPQIYWNRHWDCFQLFRDGTPDIPSWYTGHNYHQSDVYGFNLNVQYQWKYGIMNFGGEFRNEGILSNVLGKPMETPIDKYTKSGNRSNISYFLEQSFLSEHFTLVLGLLVNQNTALLNEDFGFYPNINASYRFSNSVSLFAAWNNAMRMPTFTDLYYNTPTHIGNAQLLPEKSRSAEIGVKYANRFISAYLTGFTVRSKDVIDWVKDNPEEAKYQARNLDKLDKTGVEMNLSFYLDAVFPVLKKTYLQAGYVFVDQTKNTQDLISSYALDYLKHKFTLQLNHPIYKGLSANWQFRWQDRVGSYTEAGTGNQIPYPAYSLLDLKLNWKLKDFNIYVSANNLFDLKYYDLGDIPQPGFWLSGGVNYIFNL